MNINRLSSTEAYQRRSRSSAMPLINSRKATCCSWNGVRTSW